MGLDVVPRISRAVALDRAAAWRLALGGLVVGSIVLRTWAAWQRVTPNYFPDESIYATLSRSIAHGHLPAVRGKVAHFPALLQPLLIAPAWWFGSLETGYRATQAIESVAVSTAGLAMWWTARRLGLGRGSAFAAAAIALAVPDAGYTGWILAEPFAYPLFIAAIGAGTVALAAPTRRAQGLFLGLVVLASLARMQLAVLLVVYVVAAAVLRRLRTQRVVLGALGLALVFGVAGGLGYYRDAPSALQLVGPQTVGRNLLVLALAAGWVIVPAGCSACVPRRSAHATRSNAASASSPGPHCVQSSRSHRRTALSASSTSATAPTRCRSSRSASCSLPTVAGRGSARTRCSPPSCSPPRRPRRCRAGPRPAAMHTLSS